MDPFPNSPAIISTSLQPAHIGLHQIACTELFHPRLCANPNMLCTGVTLLSIKHPDYPEFLPDIHKSPASSLHAPPTRDSNPPDTAAAAAIEAIRMLVLFTVRNYFLILRSLNLSAKAEERSLYPVFRRK